jgi:hypothetical protein
MLLTRTILGVQSLRKIISVGTRTKKRFNTSALDNINVLRPQCLPTFANRRCAFYRRYHSSIGYFPDSHNNTGSIPGGGQGGSMLHRLPCRFTSGCMLHSSRVVPGDITLGSSTEAVRASPPLMEKLIVIHLQKKLFTF